MCSHAQLQNSIWLFGDYGGINFTTSPPTPAYTPVGSPLYAPEAAATYCDPTTGELKLFTNSVEIIDKNGNNIQGSGALNGATTATQTVIVPKPGSASLVYVFTVHGFAGLWIGGGLGGGLNYSIIDLSLNGGLGAAVSTDIFLIGPTTEKLVVVKGCTGKDYWIVCHLWNSNAFYSYHLTDAGLNPVPVISNVGSVHQNSGGPNPGYEAIGQMKISRDYTKLAVAIGKGIQRFELFNFDNTNGQVGTLIFSDNSFPMFNGFQSLYGCEFSPDGSKLYLSEESQNYEYVFQYNLASGVPATMLASRTIVLNQGFATSYGGLQLGPDGRIYVAKGESTLDVIRNPNAAGAACNYQVDGMALATFGTAILGLPNLVDIDIPVTETASLTWKGCGANSQVLSFINGSWPLPITSFKWNFGDAGSGAQNFSALRNPQHTFSANGSYTVQLIVEYGCVLDTLEQAVTVTDCPVSGITGIKIAGDTCDAASAIIFQVVGTSSSPYFSWNFGDPASGVNNTVTITGASANPNPPHIFSAPGTYTVCASFQEPGFPVSQVCRTIKIGQCCAGSATNSTTTIPICSNQLPYTWNGTAYTGAGTFTKTLLNAAGCDSIATLVLTVKATSSSSTNIPICSNQLPYSWNGNTYTGAGTFTKTLVNAAGCDSIATLVLTVKATSTSTTNVTVCDGQLPYIWNGVSYSAGSIYVANLINAAGCDSIASLVLNVTGPCPTGIFAIKIAGDTCDASSAIIFQAEGTSGSPYFSWNFGDPASGVNNTDSITGASPNPNPSHTFTSPGIYTVCVSLQEPGFPVSQVCRTIKIGLCCVTTTGTDSISICSLQLPYAWNGSTYNGAGTYTKTLVNAAGCDSIATLVLTLKTNSTSTTNIPICSNQLPYTWNGTAYTGAGTFVKTLVNAAGCDSIATLVLTLKPNSTSITNIPICSNQLPYTWNGSAYTGAGTFTKTLVNAVGCDSIATLILTLKPNSTSITNIPICSNQLPYTWNGTAYTGAGTFVKTLVNEAGCDSVATLVLTIKPNSTSTTNIPICSNQLPYIWNGSAYTGAGTFTKTLVNAAGCDSVATLVLTIKPNSASTTTIPICSNQLPYTWNGTGYTGAGTFVKILLNAAGCDSIATLVLTLKPNSTSTTNIPICSNQLPYSWNGNSYTGAGTFTKTLVNVNGCDSIATLILTVSNVLSSITTQPICSNQLPYTWNGQTYNAAGTYTVRLTSVPGCDSIATLVLTLNPNSFSTTNKTICTNQLPYTWNGTAYNSAGTFVKTLANAAGCDSIATLVLTIKNIPAPSLGKDTIVCAGDSLSLYPGAYTSYTWQDFSTNPFYQVKQPGNYQVTVTDNDGCTNKASIAVSYTNCGDIYFPNAIVPNGIGNNKSFGALGNLFAVSNYSLQVYNRYGELVFSTQNPYQRWNGSYKGKQEGNISFTWYASYQLNGKRKKAQKGSLVIIR